MNVQNLAADVLICCLEYLQDTELLQVACVDKHFQGLARYTELWNFHLQHNLGIDDDSYPPGYDLEGVVRATNSPKLQYMAWKRCFAGYLMEDVRTVRVWWRRFTQWCLEHAPNIVDTFGPPAEERYIQMVETASGVKFPASLRLLYRFHDGQPGVNFIDPLLGMFGGTIFYGMVTCMRFCELGDIIKAPIDLALGDETYHIRKSIAFGQFAAHPDTITKLYVIAPDPRNEENHIVCVNGGY
jgi:hypothetical protein